MGYCTDYNLSAYKYEGAYPGPAISEEEHDAIVKSLRKIGVIGYALDSNLDCLDPVHWYNHSADMIDISKEFPDLIFCLHGVGSLNEDIWDKYYQNGREQKCYAEIIIPPFNPLDL